MPKLTINKESFAGRDGKPVEYERLVIQSEKNPALKAELRIEKNEIALIQAIQTIDGVK